MYHVTETNRVPKRKGYDTAIQSKATLDLMNDTAIQSKATLDLMNEYSEVKLLAHRISFTIGVQGLLPTEAKNATCLK